MTIKQLEKLKADGYIRDFSVESRSVRKQYLRKQGKEKLWILATLTTWCKERNLVLVEELKFHPDRKWRFDYAIASLKVAIEYEGVMASKSRHTTVKGYTGDTEKYNAATAAGWKVYRYTAINYKDLAQDLEREGAALKQGVSD